MSSVFKNFGIFSCSPIKKGVKKTAKHVSKDWKETENYLREKGLTREKIADSTGITYVKEAFKNKDKADAENK